MPLRLDLSTGPDDFIEVIVSGWSRERKRLFRQEAMEITGVTSVDSAGGNRAFHIHFTPTLTNAEAVRNELAAVARIPEPMAPGFEGVPLQTIPATEDPGPPTIASASWTGIETGAQRARAVGALLPAVADAVAALIIDLEGYRDNGGPPLQDRAEALATLKQLHGALGEILTLAERGSLETGQGLELLGDIRNLANRACKLFVDDPVRCSVVVIAATVAAWLGPVGAVVAGVGALAGLVPPRDRKN